MLHVAGTHTGCVNVVEEGRRLGRTSDGGHKHGGLRFGPGRHPGARVGACLVAFPRPSAAQGGLLLRLEALERQLADVAQWGADGRPRGLQVATSVRRFRLPELRGSEVGLEDFRGRARPPARSGCRRCGRPPRNGRARLRAHRVHEWVGSRRCQLRCPAMSELMKSTQRRPSSGSNSSPVNNEDQATGVSGRTVERRGPNPPSRERREGVGRFPCAKRSRTGYRNR
jgi:hypothetical protein